MSELFITWIMWAIVTTANPNVNIIAVIDEYPEPGQCRKVAEMVGEAAIEDLRAKKAPVKGISIACIPVLTRK